MTDRFVPLAGTYNLRDAGGYPTPAGADPNGAVRRGELFRSDALHALDDAGRAAFAALGIRTIIDLRDPREIAGRPDAVGDTVRMLAMPVFDGAAPTSAVSGATLAALYTHMIDDRGAPLAAAVGAIAHADGPVLVHCTAGKDRTGLVVALALLAVGVAEEDVIADYAETESRLAGEWVEGVLAMVGAMGIEVDDGMRTVMSASPAEELRAVIARLDAGWGGARGYLTAHGLTAADLTDLEAKLVG